MNNALLVVLCLLSFAGGAWALYDILPNGFKRFIHYYVLHEEKSS